MTLLDYANALFALLVVLGLIAGLAWGLRRFGLIRGAGAGRPGRRLAVVESLALDARHRLHLVRRDGVEHLLLTGPAGATVVETGITAAGTEEDR